MLENTYLTLILVFFILAFAVKNIKLYLSLNQSIKGTSVKLSISILISTLIYIIILFRLYILDPKWILEIDLSEYLILKITGLIFISIGFVLGILALVTMKNSWRVGIKYDQKPDLITSGIFRISRNPYFLSYNILILGYILIFPSIVLFILYLMLSVVFHKMILEEENYLQSIHKTKYLNYRKKVNRYLTIRKH